LHAIELQLLALLIVANGVPILARNLLGKRWGGALDAGLPFVDGRPLLGRSKTVRGVLCTIVVTGAVAPVLGISPGQGCLLGALSMSGDLISSFVKRRLGLEPSSRALGLDQVPESLMPLLLMKESLGLVWPEILRITVLFFVLELALSPLLYRLGIRDRPY